MCLKGGKCICSKDEKENIFTVEVNLKIGVFHVPKSQIYFNKLFPSLQELI